MEKHALIDVEGLRVESTCSCCLTFRRLIRLSGISLAISLLTDNLDLCFGEVDIVSWRGVSVIPVISPMSKLGLKCTLVELLGDG